MPVWDTVNRRGTWHMRPTMTTSKGQSEPVRRHCPPELILRGKYRRKLSGAHRRFVLLAIAETNTSRPAPTPQKTDIKTPVLGPQAPKTEQMLTRVYTHSQNRRRQTDGQTERRTHWQPVSASASLRLRDSAQELGLCSRCMVSNLRGLQTNTWPISAAETRWRSSLPLRYSASRLRLNAAKSSEKAQVDMKCSRVNNGIEN